MKKANTPAAPASRDRFVTKEEVMAMFGNISKGTLYRWIADGQFPRPIRMGPAGTTKRIGFLQSHLDAHMANLERQAHLEQQRDAHRDVA